MKTSRLNNVSVGSKAGEQRHAKATKEEDYLREIEREASLNQRTFWALINRRYKPKTTAGPSMKPFVNSEGHVLTDENAIVEGWKNYFEALYTPKSQPHYDQGFKDETEGRFRDLSAATAAPAESTILNMPISRHDVTKACRKLKTGKAPGADGMQPEHLKYGGSIFLGLVTQLFNAIVHHEYRPPVLKRGIIVPIPKGGKDSTLPDNNRGITLMPVLSKLLDSILLQRVDHWFVSKLDSLQGANRAGSSSIETAAVLQELIAQNLNRRNTVYVVLLDVKKAFDTVWHEGMFVKLHDMGLDPKLWRLLVNSYSNFKCSVRVGTKQSEWFEPQQGVHQGDVFSMRLHSLYVNGLLEGLRAGVRGALIHALICGHPSFADDVAMAALSKRALNAQLRTSFTYSCRWRYEFAPPKTYCLAFGPDTEPKVDILLNGTRLKVVSGHTHVGVPLCSNKTAEKDLTHERVKTCRRKFFAVEGVSGPSARMAPLTLSKVYNAVCVPALCYGAEVWVPSDKAMQEMEKAHEQIGRRIQNLPPTASTPVSHSLLGWKSIEALFDLAKLMWIIRLLALPSTSLYNQLSLLCINQRRFNTASLKHTGPFSALLGVCQKYHLVTYLFSMMDSGRLVPKRQWRKLCCAAVHERLQRQWCMTRIMYPRLRFFNVLVKGISICVWWTVCKQNSRHTRQCQTVVQLITGENSLNSYRGRYPNRTHVCVLCDSGETETVDHLVSVCGGLSLSRARLWDIAAQHLPHGMLGCLAAMGPRQKTNFLCSAFNSPYIPEWQESYEAVASFLSGLYRERQSLCASINST